MTNYQVIYKGKKCLEQKHIDEAELNAWYLFEYVFDMKKAMYYLRQNEEADEKKTDEYFSLIEKRSTHIPLEHLIGTTEFMGIEFSVSEDVLIPRQDTEILVEHALSYVANKKVLDMCTGSGCIGISLLALGNAKSVTLSDVSEKALRIAQKNVLKIFKKEKIEEVAAIELIQSDIFSNITGCYDVIVSNPPYIPTSMIDTLMPEVRDYEPEIALDGKDDGLFFYREIARMAPMFLNDGGLIFFEIGCEQGRTVLDILEEAGFRDVYVYKDLAGLDRVVTGKISIY